VLVQTGLVCCMGLGSSTVLSCSLVLGWVRLFWAVLVWVHEICWGCIGRARGPVWAGLRSCGGMAWAMLGSFLGLWWSWLY
jgi:hypothetical protein